MDVDKLALAHPPQGQNGQRNEGNEDEAQGAIGVNGPAQQQAEPCLLYTSPSPRDATLSRMPSSA